jgi:protein tyrosine phosphatase (PTP) superfamily phosphohydrolase (DUF442 family)
LRKGLGFHDWLLSVQRKLEARFTHDIVDPHHRRRSQQFVDWFDHGILRRPWHNFAEVAPGLFRANHPDAARLEDYARRGIKSVLNLRGALHQSPYKFEAEACARLGLPLVVVPMSARQAPNALAVLALIDAFESMPRPILVHCKSGADRTGLAGAIWLLVIEGRPLAEARRQLSPRFLHFRWSKTGILDRFLDAYEQRLAQGPIAFPDWVRTEYSAQALIEASR